VSEHRKGDKIRIKRGELADKRGILLHPHSGKWVVSIPDPDVTLMVSAEEFTNYSLAARRAWRSMPDRKVGRPVGSKVSDRVSVIFRIDRTLWNQFLSAEENGLIGDRTTVINKCLRDILASCQRQQAKAS
jgi:hypothetical protein